MFESIVKGLTLIILFIVLIISSVLSWDMKIRIFGIISLIFFISIPTLASESVFHIQLSSVNYRELYGGLGSSLNKPLGSITEFIADDLDQTSLISLPGNHAEQFNSKNIYIFKNSNFLSRSKYLVCPDDILNSKCLDCGSDCQQPDAIKKLKKFHDLTLIHSKMKLIKEMNYSAKIDQGQNKILEFQFPQKGQSPLSLLGQKGRTDPFQSTVYILQNSEENYYLICPKPQYSSECLTCIDCRGKMQQIQSFLPIK